MSLVPTTRPRTGLHAVARALGTAAWRALPNVAGVVALCFLLLQLVPGDAADVLAGQAGSATADTMALLRRQLGLDRPVLDQLLNYLSGLAHGSLGQSARFGVPVAQLIAAAMPATVLLMLSALVVALAAGVAIGWFMAVFANRWPDRLLQLLVLLFYSMPGFWIGLMAIVLFSVKLGWLPSGGNVSVGVPLRGWNLVADRVAHLVLPSFALSSFFLAVYARLTRAAMLEAQAMDYMRTAVAKGLHPVRVLVRHALRNALIPVTTVAGMNIGNLLGGAIVVETVYGWPGMGRLALDAVAGRDYPLLLGLLLLSSLLVTAANVAVDLLHALLDPRIGSR